MKHYKLGLLGMGTVGSGVFSILNENYSKIFEQIGCEVSIDKILVRTLDKPRKVQIAQDKYTTRVEDILENDAIDIVVELMGGIEPTIDYIKTALKNKKHIITANKALLATHGQELLALAKENGVWIRYEASVGGGIPIIGTLTEDLAINRFHQITGIINGTTNYILTLMTEKGMDFDEALHLAMENGYAEADPSSDVEGEDAAFKLAILIAIAYGVQVNPRQIPREGISRISKIEVEYAKRLGYKIKLLANAKLSEDTLITYVHPVLVPEKHPLAAVSNEFNALYVRGNAVGEVMLYGKGAGMLPTGSAVVSDIVKVIHDITIGHKPVEKKPQEDISINYMGEGMGEYYIRMTAADNPGVLGKIANTFAKYGISIESVVQQGGDESYIPLVFITHMVQRENLDSALKEIEAFDIVQEIASIIKVEKFL